MRARRHPAFFILAPLFLALLLLPCNAHAYSGNPTDQLSCDSSGAPSSGTGMFDTTGCQDLSGIEHVFSWIICNFEQVLNTVMDNMYCGIQNYFTTNVLAPLLSVYVAIFGVQILIGKTQLQGRDILLRLFKIAAVIMFTTAAYGTGIVLAFDFFMAFISDTVSWVLAPAMQQSGSDTPITFYDAMDGLVYSAVIGPFTKTNSSVLGFFAVMAVTFPMVFTMAAYWLWMNFLIVVRALLSYIMGITVIAFLITLSPIFLACMLFQVTYHFFDNWLKYMMSYALQITIMMAGTAMWLDALSFFPPFFNALSQLIIHDPKLLLESAIGKPENTWGVCKDYLNANYNADYAYQPPSAPASAPGWIGPWITMPDDSTPVTCSGPSSIMFASDLIKNEDFIYYIIFNLTCLVIVNYAFNALLKSVPNLAQQLAGPAFTPMVGKGLGGQSFSSFRANTDNALGAFGKNMPGKPGADGKSAASSMLSKAIGKMTGGRTAPG